jgi:hypothetical protein
VIGLAIALVAALAGSALGLAVRAGDEDDDRAGDATAGDDPRTTDTTAPPEPATEDEVRAAVDELSTFVEDERGLDFLEPVEVTMLPDDEFQARTLADFDEVERSEVEGTQVVLAAFGLVEPDLDVYEALRSLTGAGVVGFYDPETGELVVRGAALTPYVRSIIAHELTHALDDQHFELYRPELDDAEDESGFGFSALVEGSASVVEEAYVASLPDDEQDALQEELLGLAGGLDMAATPYVLVESMSAPYTYGADLVTAVRDDGGRERLDVAFDEPPTTSEQVLEPDAFLAGEAAVTVATPEVGGEVVEQGALGAYTLGLALRGPGFADPPEGVEEALAGWGGDAATAWRDGDRSCVTASVVGDDADATDALQEVVEAWAADQPAATVTPPAAAGQPFVLDACSS